MTSFQAQFAVNAIKHDNRTTFLRNMAVTLVLGITFLALQMYDYSILIHEGLTMSSGTFPPMSRC